MPSNMVQINRQKNLTWEVPDSKMERLMGWLSRIGKPRNQQPCAGNEWQDWDLAVEILTGYSAKTIGIGAVLADLETAPPTKLPPNRDPVVIVANIIGSEGDHKSRKLAEHIVEALRQAELLTVHP